jgi:NADP-dependent 3-hydroxy acid dehydrogenase YdfG
MKAIVTGASSGIGLAIAKQLAKEGWHIATASRSEERISDLRWQLVRASRDGREPMIVKADLSVPKEHDNFMMAVDMAWNCPDLIVCNVGTFAPDKPSTMTVEALQKQLEINAFSAIRTCSHFIHRMKIRKKGMIIFTGTILNIEPRTEAASYTLSKGLLNQYAKLLADELRPHNIRVSRIQPGSVNTPTWGTEKVPLETFVQPSDIADAVSWMVKVPESTWVEELIIRPTDKNW